MRFVLLIKKHPRAQQEPTSGEEKISALVRCGVISFEEEKNIV